MSVTQNYNYFDLTESITLFKQQFELRTQGSEARIYVGKFLNRPAILKERFEKKYRHPELDKLLTVERIRSEVRALNKCFEIGVKCPAVYFVDLLSRCIILQEIPNSISIKEYLQAIDIAENIKLDSLTCLAQKIGEGISLLHKNEIVHGDLTTSNMLLKKTSVGYDESNVYFIDFGLAKRGIVTEDKAVDLYVLERALSSSHPNSGPFFEAIMASYRPGKRSADVLEKLEEVRQRGRKRTMVG